MSSLIKKTAAVLLTLCLLLSAAGAATGTLVKFNVLDPDMSWDGTGTVTNFGSQTNTTYGPYLVYNHKVNLATDDVIVEADVLYTSTSGHNGLGFIKTNGSLCGGYTLLTAQNIKNTGGNGGGQGFEPAVDWTALTGSQLKFKVHLTGGLVKFYVYNAAGTLLTSKEDTSSTYNFSASDIVYPAIGGTNTGNMSWSNVKITVSGTEYTINGLRPQSDIPVLSVGASLIRGELGEGSLEYTATAPGGSTADITAVAADPTIIQVNSAANGTISYTALKTGTTTLTVTNSEATYISNTITFVITQYPVSNTYSSLNVYPAAGSTGAYEDGELMMQFDDTPVLSLGGSISIYEADTGNWADTVAFEDEAQTVQSGYSIKVGPQLVRVEDNKVFITPHFGKLENGKRYYVAIPNAVISGTFAGTAFTGLANSAENAWTFTVRNAPTVSSNITVDGSQTSTADFRTVYGALRAAAGTAGNIKISVAAGVYNELIQYKPNTGIEQSITIEGPAGNDKGDDCIIQYINCNDMNGSTHTRSVMYMSGINLVLKNITIINKTVRKTQYVSTAPASSNSQAETIHFANGVGKTLAAFNCSFKSHQDTLLTTGRNWFYKCYIEGDTDFIWGTADACLIERCEIKCVYDENATTHTAYLMVARTGTKTATTVGKGYVIKDCNITIANGQQAFFGRNAGAGDYYDQCAVIDSYIGPEQE